MAGILNNPMKGYTKLEDGDTRLLKHIGKNNMHHHGELRHLFVYKDQIMFDIEAQLGIIADARQKDDDTQDLKLNLIEKYKGMFDRWINKHTEEVKQQLVIAVQDQYVTNSGDEVKDWEEKEILLSMPRWWDDTTWKSLVEAVHAYVANATLSDYLKLTLTSKDQITIDKREEADSEFNRIKALLCTAKRGTVRKPVQPFGINL